MGKPRSFSEKPREIRRPNVTRAGLEAAALRYLERFDCSSARLHEVLTERVSKAIRAGVEEAAAAPRIIEQILERYQSSGLLDDQRFARNFAERQRERGASRRMIERKLLLRGISSELVQQVLPRSDAAKSELEAAEAFARRRRLGPHRKPEARDAHRKRDLMALARAGFDYDTASRVLGITSSEDEL